MRHLTRTAVFGLLIVALSAWDGRAKDREKPRKNPRNAGTPTAPRPSPTAAPMPPPVPPADDSADDGSTLKPTLVAKVTDPLRVTDTPQPLENHPLRPAMAFAEEAVAKAAELKDFTATFSRRERVQGKLYETNSQVKLRQEPFAVYMRFLKPHAGREVLFAGDRYDGKLLAHEGGLRALAGTFSFSPTSPDVMAESRYPITHMGLKSMASAVLEQWKSELPHGEVEVRYYANARLGDRPARMYESLHPVPRPHFKSFRTRLYVDEETGLPVRVEQHSWPVEPDGEPVLEEEYHYYDLKTDVGLTDADFDRKNKAYRF